MSEDVIRFRRDQLSQFLPTLELVKMFESFVLQATQTTPDAIVDVESISESRSTPSTDKRVEHKISDLASQQPKQYVDSKIEHRLQALETMQARQPDLTSINRQLAEIRAYIGM